MCSILAIVTSDYIPEVILQRAPQLLNLTKSRGPDDQGSVIIDNKIYLGNNRLSIIGNISAGNTSEGKMPIKSLSGDYWISFNGVIYNYKEIKKDLLLQGFKFRSQTDTEVLLNAYVLWGDKFIEKLNGVFAFVIYDKQRNAVIAGRDRFGGRPLFYTTINNMLYLSSDFKVLNDLAYPHNKTIDLSALSACLECRFVPGYKTVSKGIFKLQPAEMIVWRINDLSQTNTKYWQPQFNPHPFSQEEFNQKLVSAVNSTKTADVTPTVLLSGGIDSAAVAAIMKGLGDDKVSTFTFSFTNAEKMSDETLPMHQITTPNIDERDRAKVIADYLHFSNESFMGNYDIGVEQFIDMMNILGEPITSTNALGNYLFAKALKGKTKLVLAGTGSDELLGGYLDLYFKEKNKSLESTKDPSVFLRALADFDSGLIAPLDFLDPSISQPEYINDYAITSLESFPSNRYPNEILNQLAFFELTFALPGWENDQADRLYMGQSIEPRAAFLENNFVDYALTIPSADKVNKIPLRKSMQSLLPASITNFVKYPGMSTPKELCKNAWFKELINELFEHPLEIWNKQSIASLAKQPYDDWNFDILYRLVYLQLWISENKYKL